jgi:hypothetical protein
METFKKGKERALAISDDDGFQKAEKSDIHDQAGSGDDNPRETGRDKGKFTTSDASDDDFQAFNQDFATRHVSIVC